MEHDKSHLESLTNSTRYEAMKLYTEYADKLAECVKLTKLPEQFNAEGSETKEHLEFYSLYARMKRKATMWELDVISTAFLEKSFECVCRSRKQNQETDASFFHNFDETLFKMAENHFSLVRDILDVYERHEP